MSFLIDRYYLLNLVAKIIKDYEVYLRKIKIDCPWPKDYIDLGLKRK